MHCCETPGNTAPYFWPILNKIIYEGVYFFVVRSKIHNTFGNQCIRAEVAEVSFLITKNGTFFKELSQLPSYKSLTDTMEVY